MQLHRYLEDLWRVIAIGNKAIEVAAPWSKMKEGKTDEAMAVIALAANILARVAIMLSPVMPSTMQKIGEALHFTIATETFEALILRNELLAVTTMVKIPPLFPKIEEVKKEAKIEDKPQQTELVIENPITIDQFFATQIKVGTILTAQTLPKSDKLLQLSVDLGEARPRQILSGIREHYSPESLIGKQVCVVANLKPAKIMGIVSEGMILAAKDDNGLVLVEPHHHKAPGTLVK